MPVTPPRHTGMGPRPGFMSQRSPRYTSPRQPGPHPVSLRPARHEPYPNVRPLRRGSINLDAQGKPIGGEQSPVTPSGNKADGQVIKIEPDDDENQSAAQESNQPSSPSVDPSTAPKTEFPETNNDAKSETNSSTIPNDSSDFNKLSDTVLPGGLSLDSDLSNLISEASNTSADSGQDTNTGAGLDPNVTVKNETLTDSDMDLEITGVEPGSHMAVEQQMGSQDWAMGGLPSGTAGGSSDTAAGKQGYSK